MADDYIRNAQGNPMAAEGPVVMLDQLEEPELYFTHLLIRAKARREPLTTERAEEADAYLARYSNATEGDRAALMCRGAEMLMDRGVLRVVRIDPTDGQPVFQFTNPAWAAYFDKVVPSTAPTA